MKKILLFASALTGFAMVAQAQEATTIKTTTVQYQVPTCTNCRTTTTTATTYPEPEPVCETCTEAKPVMMKRKEKRKVNLKCHDNHDLGIRNPLFRLQEGQLSIQQVDGLFREPKRKTHLPDGSKDDKMEYHGWDAQGRVAYGITDRWQVEISGAKQYAIPKTKQYRAWMKEEYGDAYAHPIPHITTYDAQIETNYHILDLCHLDVFAGLRGGWYRTKTKLGDSVQRITGWRWGPAVTVGSNFGWFSPYVTAAYEWTHTHDWVDMSYSKKHWVDDHGYFVNPGIYIQPSKWYAFDVSMSKQEDRTAFWYAGVDFYPYKNIVLGVQAHAQHPLRHPMHEQGLAATAKVVF